MNLPTRIARCALLGLALVSACAEDSEPKEGCTWRVTADKEAGGVENEGTCLLVNGTSNAPFLVPPSDMQVGAGRPLLRTLVVPLVTAPPFSIKTGDPANSDKIVVVVNQYDASGQPRGIWMCGSEARAGTFNLRVDEFETTGNDLRAKVMLDAECPVDPRRSTELGGRVKVHVEFVARPAPVEE